MSAIRWPGRWICSLMRKAHVGVLGLPAQVLTVAVLPGSRSSELDRMTGPFIETAAWLDARYDEIQFVANVVDEIAERRLSAAAKSRGLQLKIVKNRIGDTLAACGCCTGGFRYGYPGSDAAQSSHGGGLQNA